jgi:hypothetical protein
LVVYFVLLSGINAVKVERFELPTKVIKTSSTSTEGAQNAAGGPEGVRAEPE